MPLIECIECGNTVSDRVHTCIHCHQNPVGFPCFLCGDYMPGSTMTMSGDLRYHSSCMRKYLDEFRSTSHGVNCPECGNGLDHVPDSNELLELWDEYNYTCASLSCEFCGCPKIMDYRGKCDKCHLPVYGAVHRYAEIQTKDLNRWDDPWIPQRCYHDPFCTPRIVEQEHRQQRLAIIEKNTVVAVPIYYGNGDRAKTKSILHSLFLFFLPILIVALILSAAIFTGFIDGSFLYHRVLEILRTLF